MSWRADGVRRRLTVTSVIPGADTLQAAVNAASAGDVLELADGTYTVSIGMQVVLIAKDITIRAVNSFEAVLDAENVGGRRVVTIGSVRFYRFR